MTYFHLINFLNENINLVYKLELLINSHFRNGYIIIAE